MQSKDRSRECIKYGIIDTIIIALIITIIFEIFAEPLASVFALTSSSNSQLVEVCQRATRIASLGYAFMGISIAIQGVLQALRYAVAPFITALFRLIIFVLPLAYIFTLTNNVVELLWWTFPIAEVLTSVISIAILAIVYKKKIKNME